MSVILLTLLTTFGLTVVAIAAHQRRPATSPVRVRETDPERDPTP